jgi:hypothetical protein
VGDRVTIVKESLATAEAAYVHSDHEPLPD